MIFISSFSNGEKKERERNTRKSRFAPNENAKIHGGSRGMICNLFFPSASRREFIAEKIRVSASPLPINTIPITSGVRLSRIRVPWQLATYLPSSFPSLLFHFVSWKQKYTYIIGGERKYGVLKKNNEKEEEEKEDGKGKERFDATSLPLINVISITPRTSRGVFEISTIFSHFYFYPLFPSIPRIDRRLIKK